MNKINNIIITENTATKIPSDKINNADVYKIMFSDNIRGTINSNPNNCIIRFSMRLHYGPLITNDIISKFNELFVSVPELGDGYFSGRLEDMMDTVIRINSSYDRKSAAIGPQSNVELNYII